MAIQQDGKMQPEFPQHFPGSKFGLLIGLQTKLLSRLEL